MRSPITPTILLAALLLGGCEGNGMQLIGSENCIICIRDMSKPRDKTKATAKKPQQMPQDGSMDDDDVFGLADVPQSRYGTFSKRMNPGNDGQVLFFNDKLITDSMAPSGYQHLEDSPYGGVGSYIHFDDKAPRQLGTYDIYSIFISNGGNIQRRYPYILLAIGPDKVPRTMGGDLMESHEAHYRIEGNRFIAEYDDITVTFADGRFIDKKKDLWNIPDNLCREMYDNRKKLAGLIKNNEDLEGIGYVAKRYVAFSPARLYRAASQKNISYSAFQQEACRERVRFK